MMGGNHIKQLQEGEENGLHDLNNYAATESPKCSYPVLTMCYNGSCYGQMCQQRHESHCLGFGTTLSIDSSVDGISESKFARMVYWQLLFLHSMIRISTLLWN